MDFANGLYIFTKWNSKIYDSILIIVDRLIKIVYYELVKVIIDAAGLAEVIINMLIQYHGLPYSIISN